LDEAALAGLLEKYGDAVTCVCFIGGDGDPREVERLAGFVRGFGGGLKTAWYSGKPLLPEGIALEYFDFIKSGPYVERSGGLGSATTNQRFYRIENGTMVDLTALFRLKD
jgi:anaerobic ribonucleoside-triphosphate reductase activating protein